MTKVCARCREAKPLDGFHRQSKGPGGRHSYCKPCYNAAYRGRNRKPVAAETRRAQNVKSRYGLTMAEVEQMLTDQGGVCAICRKPMVRQCIDHDHATNAVRGLLCHPCNIRLPHVEDAEYRIAALAYLARY